MKKISLIACSAIIASASIASAATPGSMYGSLNLGYGMIPGKVTGSSSAPAAAGDKITDAIALPNSGKLKGTANGIMITPEFGYQVTEDVRVALAYTYLMDQNVTYSKDDVGTGNTNASPKLKRSSWVALAKVYYDFLIPASDFTVFGGLGIGYGSSAYSVDSIADKAATTGLPVGKDGAFVGSIVAQKGDDTKATKKGFAYGADLGASYKINPALSVELSYAMRVLPKAETKIANIDAVKDDVVVKYKAPTILHSANLGLRFNF